ncbi:MAG: NAD(P)H-binding protein [Candidatus Eisenbacteria bacterium]
MVGRQVLESLLATDAAVRVIAREPDRVAQRARDRVDVVQGSHADPAVIDAAFEGADEVFWLVPPNPRAESVEAAYVEFTVPAAAAFTRHNVKRVVGISALGRGTPQARHAGLVTGSLAMDDLIGRTGVAYRAVTCPSFMDNLLRQVDAIRNSGMFFSPIDSDRKLPSCATRDIAAVATRLLLDTSWTGAGEAAVLGPEDLSFTDMARIMTDVLGRPVRFQQMSFDAYKARFEERGMSEVMAQAMTDMASAKNEGLDNAELRTPENTTPTRFETWCEEVLKPRVLAA